MGIERQRDITVLSQIIEKILLIVVSGDLSLILLHPPQIRQNQIYQIHPLATRTRPITILESEGMNAIGKGIKSTQIHLMIIPELEGMIAVWNEIDLTNLILICVSKRKQSLHGMAIQIF